MNSSLPPRELVRAFASLAVALALMVALLFLSAGTLSWARGWCFMLAFVLLILASMAWLWRVNPEIFVARARPTGPGTKGWDKLIMVLLLTAYAAIFVVAGLDDGRFHWAPVPDWLVLLGYGLVVLGFAGVAWAEAVNRHFEPSVRIQTDRGHTVISTGPYALVRHPGYVAGSLLATGAAWALGSWWALVPAVVVVVTMLVRTNIEDATLQQELPGYAEFVQKTRYKWLPGIW